MFDLSGRVAVVTGGNGGIGLGLGAALAEAGADLAIWGRNADKNEAARASLEPTGRRVGTWVCDVADEAQIIETFAATVAELGQVDIMIANAGVSLGGPITGMTLETWRTVMAVNLDGAFLCFREAARHLIDRGAPGSLIGVASTSAIHGAPANEAYAASKAGLAALVRGLAVELARHHIRCNTIVPGWTETELTAPLQGWEKFMTATTNRTPVRRWGVPTDFGPAAVYLADPTIDFHTGDMLVVDGGYTVF
jgi:NAD(P)-dependent dehydrogenase (short-subunit alcohol dehydrogenase family)